MSLSIQNIVESIIGNWIYGLIIIPMLTFILMIIKKFRKNCLKFITTLFKRNLYKKKDAHNEQKKSEIYDTPEDAIAEWEHARAYIYSLPKLKSELLLQKSELPNQTTPDMIEANKFYIRALMKIIERLATFYSPKYFKDISPREYFEKIISERHNFHWMTLLPDGPNTGGTLHNILIGKKIIDDIENIIENMVEGLHPLSSEGSSYSQWIKEWQQPISQ